MGYTQAQNNDQIISRRKVNCGGGCNNKNPDCPCDDDDGNTQGININLNVGSNNSPSSDYSSPYLNFPMMFPMVQFDPGYIPYVPEYVPDNYIPDSQPMPGTNEVPDVTPIPVPVPVPKEKVIELERTNVDHVNFRLPSIKYTVNKKLCADKFYIEFP